MAPQPTPVVVLVFGPFELNPSTGELRKNGIRIRLAAQPLALLARLLERAGDVVSRDELRDRLWSGGTFVDFEHGLNAAINKLRQALGDSADSPRYIETLAGRGYRFIGSVEHRMPASAPRLAAVEAVPRPAPVRRIRLIWLAPVLVMLAVSAWWVLRPKAPASSGEIVQFAVESPAGFAIAPSGARKGFGVSPDGKRIVFTASGTNGRFTLWLRDIDRLEPHAVPGTEGSHAVFWSADSQFLYFTLRNRLRRISTSGGTSTVLYDGLKSAFLGSSFTPGGDLIFADSSGIYRLGASGDPKRISPPGDRWPQVLPDGRSLLYLRFDPATVHFRVRVAPLDRLELARDIRETDSQAIYVPPSLHDGPGYLLFVRSGTLVAQAFDPGSLQFRGEAMPLVQQVYTFTTGAADFSASPNGVLAYLNFANHADIRWMDRSGLPGQTIGQTSAASKYVRLSPDGKSIATAVYNAERCVNEIWIVDVATGVRRRMATGPGTAESPVWSPDSQQLIYGRANGNPPRLFRKGIRAEDQEVALPPGPFQVPTSWSPDGRFISFTDASFPSLEGDNEGDVWLMDLKAGNRILPLLNSPFREREGNFSPDGKAIAFLSNESGAEEVYTQEFESGAAPRVRGPRHAISQGGAITLRWRPDGREIVYLSPDGFLYGVPVSPSYTAAGNPVQLLKVPPESLSILPTSFGFDISADGRRLLLAGAVGRSSLTVVRNWELLLQRSISERRESQSH